MELNINSPAYYSREYGIDDDIYHLCRQISDYVQEKRYSELIESVGITPIIAPYEVIQAGKFKETKRCEPKYGFAYVSIQIDYIEYTKANKEEKKKLIIKCILKSMKIIKKRGKLDFIQFEKDIKMFCLEQGIDL